MRALLSLLLAWAAPAAAGVLEIAVRAAGTPVADAVLAVRVADGGSAPPPPPARRHVIDQRDETFLPYLQLFRPGDQVVFRNSDRTRHHVYTFAPAQPFEFVLAPGEDSAPLTLGHAVAIAVGCNIHDQMIAHLYVSDAPWLARTGSDGQARLPLAPGRYALEIWHPRLRPGAPPLRREAFVAAGDELLRLEFELTLLPDRRRDQDPERSDY